MQARNGQSSQQIENRGCRGPLDSPPPPFDEDLLSTSRCKRRRRALKITQCSMVKRSYGSIWQSVFVSVRLSLSHHRSFDCKKNKESCIFITKCCSFFLHHSYKTSVKSTFSPLWARMVVLIRILPRDQINLPEIMCKLTVNYIYLLKHYLL